MSLDVTRAKNSSSPKTATTPPATPPVAVGGSQRFYVGGNIYETWASVPNRYKVEDPNFPDPSRSTASIFKFTW